MRQYEISFKSVNSHLWPGKPTVMLVMEPDKIDENTGVMLFNHGWGGNRFQYEELMAFAIEKYNVIGLSVEFRQSGYDFDPMSGNGACLPYDASFYQVFDVLLGLKEFLLLKSGIDRRRICHFGGSQGGHIALLSAIFAPDTFSFVYATSPAVMINPEIANWAGRSFAPHEFSIRNVLEHAAEIKCPLFLEHGGSDDLLPHYEHTLLLENKLKELKKKFSVKYYMNGDHGLLPETTRLESFKKRAPRAFKIMKPTSFDDLTGGTVVKINCGGKTLVIDWAQTSAYDKFIQWL